MLGQLCRFGVSGFINTIIDFSLFNIFVYFSGIHSGILLALINSAAVGIAAINSYYLNRNWTFNGRTSGSRTQVFRFIGATLTGLLLNSLIVTAVGNLTPVIPLPGIISLNAGKILASGISATWNFFTYRHWVFPCRQTAPAHDRSCISGLVSVIIPAYNEAERLPARLQNLAATLPGFFPTEIIIVDDGSNDRTLAIIKNLAEQFPFIKGLSYSTNCGKGKAVQNGIQASRGEYLIYTDADHTFTAYHIRQIALELQSGADIVIGCRGRCQGHGLEGESALRKMMGRVFNGLVQGILLPGIEDTQCGLKGFQRAAALDVFSRQTINRFAFDVEILVLARRLGYIIKQFPVTGMDCNGSRVNCWLAPFQMGLDLIKIRGNLLTNRYALPGGNQSILELGLMSSLFTAALAVRIPWLWEVPRFIDELKEVQVAYLIYAGENFPLHNAAQDIGALHNYILALLFKICGPSIYWPRLYVAVTGALTVVLLYYTTGRLYGRKAGLLAAVLLLTNGMHILVTHMAWSNCTTPFFFTLALIAVLNAEKLRSGWWLILSGLLWGLALQTHSSIIIFVLVTLVYVLRPRFRSNTCISPVYYIGSALAFMLAYLNMILFNIRSGGGSIRWLTHKPYALESQISINHYLLNLRELLLELARSLGSIYTTYDHEWQYLIHPVFLLVSLLLLTGLYRSIRKKVNLPVWLLLGGIILIPVFNKRYDFYISTRYIMPLVLTAIMIIGMSARHWYESFKKPGFRNLSAKTAAFLVVVLVSLQLLPLYHYCREVADTNASNRMALTILSLAGDTGGDQPPRVLIDSTLSLENEPLPYLFTLRQQPYQILASGVEQPGEWLNCLQPTSEDRLVAVMNEQTFHRLKNWIEPARISILNSRIVIPTTSSEHRQIYVVEMNHPPEKQAAVK